MTLDSKGVIAVRALCVMIISFLASSGALAQADCASKLTTPEIGGCLFEKYQESDAALNAVYSRLVNALETKNEKESMRKAQRTWVVFRDAECEYVDSQDPARGGFMKWICLEKATAKRTKELEEHLEGVLSRSW